MPDDGGEPKGEPTQGNRGVPGPAELGASKGEQRWGTPAPLVGDHTHQPVRPVSGADETSAMRLPGDGLDRPSLHVRLFATHQFFRLWIAQVVSALGDWIGFLAIIVMAGRIGSSPEAAIGLVTSARILPGFFLGPVTGVIVDRWDRKKVMVTCDVGRACVLAVLPFVPNLAGLVIASLLLEAFTLMWQPAKEATIPNLVPQDHLTTANSLSLAAAYGTFPIASLVFAGLAALARWLGGFDALSFLSLNQEVLAFYVDVVTFLTSAALIWSLDLPQRPKTERATEGTASIRFGEAFNDLREGWRYVFLNPVVRAVNLGLATGLMGAGMLIPLGPVFTVDVLGAGPAGFGVFITALGFGLAFGVGATSMVQKRLPGDRLFVLSVVGSGICLFGAALTSTLTPAALLVGAMGMCGGAIYVTGFTLLQQHTPDELRGRAFSALYTLVRLCILLAMPLGPLLSGILGSISESLVGQEAQLFGISVYVPGVRLAIWFAALIIMGAGLLAAHSLAEVDGRSARDVFRSGNGKESDDATDGGDLERTDGGSGKLASRRSAEPLVDGPASASSEAEDAS